MTETKEDHLALYNEIDLALDTTPYNGTTTSFEAIWMGVPVLTQVGDFHAARVSYSILSNLSMDQFIATSTADYIQKAIGFSRDKKSFHYANLTGKT